MAYSDFTLPGLIDRFQLKIIEDQELFADIDLLGVFLHVVGEDDVAPVEQMKAA